MKVRQIGKTVTHFAVRLKVVFTVKYDYDLSIDP